jgi:hypothetical protein
MTQPGIDDYTKDFFHSRQEHKVLVSSILAAKMEWHLEKSAKTVASTDTLGSLLAAFSSTGHCLSCGQVFHMFNKEILCCICKKQYCSNCVMVVNDKSVLELITANPVSSEEPSYTCEKCRPILLFQKEKQVRNKFRALKEQNPLSEIYPDIIKRKEQIKQLMPQYEYLVTSITDIKIAGSSERDNNSFGLSYTQVKLKERKLMSLLKEFEEGSKLLETVKVVTATDKSLLANIKKSFANFLQDNVILFQDIQKKVAKIELNSVVHVYLFLKQLEWEIRFNSKVTQFRKILDQVSEHIMREINQICTMNVQSDWEKVKTQISNRLKKRQQAVTTQPLSALIPPKDNKQSLKDTVSSIPESMLVRKITTLIRDQHKRFIARCIHAPMTAKVQAFLIHKLEKGFDDELMVFSPENTQQEAKKNDDV